MRYGKTRRHLPLFLIAGLSLGFAACGDNPAAPAGGGSGGGTFNPQQTAQTVSGVQGDLAGGNVVPTLSLIGPALAAASGGTPSVVPGNLDQPRLAVASLAVKSFVLSGGGAAVPIFPANLLGKTFVWDTATAAYVVDSTLTGAPANGVRFLLYAIDPFTGKPASPLNQIGHVDLVDQSTPSSTRLGVTAVSGGATVVDYFIDASFSVTGQDVTVTLLGQGFLTDSSQRIDFDLNQSGTFTQGATTFTLDAMHDISVTAAGLSVSLDVNGTFDLTSEDPSAATATVTVVNGADTLVISIQITNATQLAGTIAFNGNTAVIIGGTVDAPTFTNPDGTPVDPSDLTALDDLENLFDDVFDFAEAIFEPFDDGM
ncbi:MAG: hypothetical protein ACE5HF_02985 [Gemmatimonadota bacterium]